MKKIIALVLATICMALLLIACGSKESASICTADILSAKKMRSGVITW